MKARSASAPSPLLAWMELVSFDGGVRRRHQVARPDRYRHLEMLPIDQPRIVRGGGYSYAAAGFGADTVVQDARAFDRLLAFDGDHGVLECEAGVTLGKIHRFATPRGWFLPVQPGYPQITVGGCIAADVHGKNQYRDGTFRQVVRSLCLFHPRHGVLEADSARHAELFDLTCGGLGLTGQILSARLQLARLPSHRVQLRRVRIDRFEDTLPLLEEHAPGAEFIYTWHDLSRGGSGRGGGFLYLGRFLPAVPAGAADAWAVASPIDARSREGFRVPLFNRATVGPFNASYGGVQALSRAEREIALYEFLFPVARKVVYFKLFGKRGFHEYQAIVPREAFGALVHELRRSLDREAVPVTLASAKLFAGGRSQIRFDGDGVCLALDFPRGPQGQRFAAFLDRVTCDLGGLPNIVKDSRLPRAVFEACYPEHHAFRERLQRFDPDRLYRSEVSERLGL